MDLQTESFEVTTGGKRLFRFDLDSIVDLLLRPEQFFRAYLEARPNAFPLLAMWFVGMGTVINRAGSRLMMAEAQGTGATSGFGGFVSDWSAFWGLTIVGGLVTGLLVWLIWGWWYRMRLLLSGAQNPDPTKARLVFIHAQLIWSVPLILTALAQVTAYDSYQASYDSASFALVWMTAPIWSAFVSYRGAIGCFDVDRKKARIWFLILPIGFEILVGGIAFMGLALAG